MEFCAEPCYGNNLPDLTGLRGSLYAEPCYRNDLPDLTGLRASLYAEPCYRNDLPGLTGLRANFWGLCVVFAGEVWVDDLLGG